MLFSTRNKLMAQTTSLHMLVICCHGQKNNYDAHKLEFLALKWFITERWHAYWYGGHFEVYTDNNPLTYIFTIIKFAATGQRYVAGLANYNFKILYRSSKLNVEADAFSQIP